MSELMRVQRITARLEIQEVGPTFSCGSPSKKVSWCEPVTKPMDAQRSLPALACSARWQREGLPLSSRSLRKEISLVCWGACPKAKSTALRLHSRRFARVSLVSWSRMMRGNPGGGSCCGGGSSNLPFRRPDSGQWAYAQGSPGVTGVCGNVAHSPVDCTSCCPAVDVIPAVYVPANVDLTVAKVCEPI